MHKLSHRILIQNSRRILILAQVVPQDPDREVQKDADTEILHKWSYRILAQAVHKDPDTEILYKWSDRILIQVARKILIERSWYKWSKRIRLLKQRSCTSGPTGSCKWSKRILIQRSWDRDLAQALLQDCRSGGKDPDAEILYKWSYRILIEVVQKDPHIESLHKWSYRILMEVVEKDLETEILHKCSWMNDDTSGPKKWSYRTPNRILDPDTSGPKRSWYRDSEILHKWSDRTLMQVVRKDPDTDLHPDAEILQKWSYTILDADTSGPKDPDTESLYK